MIREKQIIRAMRLMGDAQKLRDASSTEQDIVAKLEESLDDGEFDGSFDSAVKCLTDEGFQIELES